MRSGPVDEDPEYKLIVDCNALTVDIDNEVVLVHNFIRDKCVPRGARRRGCA